MIGVALLAVTSAAVLPVPGTSGSGPSASADPLDLPVAHYRAWHLSPESAFLALSRTYGITIEADPTLKAPLTLSADGGTVRDLLEAVARSEDAWWERDGRLVTIRRNLLQLYPVDYPQLTRTAQGSSTVVLTAQATTAPGAAGFATNALSAQGGAAGGISGAGGTDQTNLSVQQQNPNSFWTDLLAELSGLAEPGESVAVNRLAGLALITAPPRRQAVFRAFLRLVNERISRQVRISARVLEVSLNHSGALGVDWTQAAVHAGGIALGGATETAIAALNGQPLPGAAFTGTLSTGRISAVVQALAEQGEVRSVSNPSVLTLSNQTAFVKVGTEQTFFSLANSTTLNQPGAGSPFASTQNNYAQNAITIGTVLSVTPVVNTDGTVTVDVLPAVTQLIGIDASPDHQQTAPRMDIKALSTLARLHPGEAVMIGGLIHEERATTRRSVPGLGAMPLLGSLFASRASEEIRTELVIFLTAERVP